MKYKEYTGYTKTYVVVHNTGFGVQEAPYEEKEVVFETDDKQEAYAKASELRTANNSSDDIASSWVPNTYWVNVNTLSEGGKLLEKEFLIQFDERLKEGLDEGKCYVGKIGDITYYSNKKLDKFFQPEPSDGLPLSSSSFMMVDMCISPRWKYWFYSMFSCISVHSRNLENLISQPSELT